MKKKKKPKIVAVSGGFDPIHIGHIRLFEEAKKLGDKLVVILNNDNWYGVKGRKVFIPQKERKEILEALKPVDRVVLTKHKPGTKDISVCRELIELKPDIFANGGDRTKKNIPEVAVCQKINCKMIFNVGRGGKIQSSSWLLAKYANELQSKFYRPWGSFTVIEEGKNFKVKKVVVKPREKLSLQFHKQRSEHWVVLRGRARVELDNKIFYLKPHQSIDIPVGAKHRLENFSKEPLEIIEIQNGEYLGEDDIIRIDDKYKRR
jgi:cytidyltransferase-like protein